MNDFSSLSDLPCGAWWRVPTEDLLPDSNISL